MEVLYNILIEKFDVIGVGPAKHGGLSLCTAMSREDYHEEESTREPSRLQTNCVSGAESHARD